MVSVDGFSVAIIDRQSIFAFGLGTWLTMKDERVLVVYMGPNPDDAVELINETDVVLFDVSLPLYKFDSFISAGLPVLVLCDSFRNARVRAALLAGACGYICRNEEPQLFLERLWSAADGEPIITPEFAQVLTIPNSPILSEQELRTLRFYVEGMPLKSVAREMSVSQHTAKEYLDRIRAKYAARGRLVRTRAELRSVASEDGLLDQ